MAELNAWDVIDANNNAAPPDGWPENTMNYSEVNDTGRAVQGTMKRYFADINGSLAAAGTANTYTLTLNAGYTAYFDGMCFVCSIPATNTGASTMNVNSLGVKTLVDIEGNAMAGGALQSGGQYGFYYDGTNLRVTDVKRIFNNLVQFKDSIDFDRSTVQQRIGFSNAGADAIYIYGNPVATNHDVGIFDGKNSVGVVNYDESTQTLTITPSIQSPTINGEAGIGLYYYPVPVVLANTAPTLNTWSTWSEPNLATAGATHAIVSMRAQLFNNNVTSLLGGVAVKNPNDSTSNILTTVFASDRAVLPSAGQIVVYPMGRAIVPLDANQDFDYTVYAGTTGGTAVSTFELALHGFIV